MKKLFLIVCIAIHSGCSPQQDSGSVNNEKKVTRDEIQRCTGMGEPRTVEEAIIKGYRLRTCSFPEEA